MAKGAGEATDLVMTNAENISQHVADQEFWIGARKN